MIKKLLNALILLYSLAGLCQENFRCNFKKLYINEDNYSIMFPSDWEIENKDSLKYFFSLRRYKADSVDKHGGDISLHITDLDYPNIKIKKVQKIIDKRMKFNVELLSFRKIKLNNLQTLEYVFKKLDKNGNRHTFVEYFFIKEKNFYNLLFACNSSEYLETISIAQKIFETLKIK